MAFEQIVYTLTSWGVVEFLLPFLLVFVIVYATLQKTKILGEGRKNFNVVLAFLMGLAVIIPHYTGWYTTFDPVLVINRALPQVSIILVAIIMVLLIIGVFGNEVDIAGHPLSGWVVIFAVVAVVVIFGGALNWFPLPYWLTWVLTPDMQALIIMILIFGIIIYFITKEPKEQKEERKTFGDFMKGIGSFVQPKNR